MMIGHVMKEPREKERRITLRSENITTDIDRLTYKLADTAVEGVAKDSISSDSEDNLDGAIISRLLNERAAVLRKRLTFCLKPETIVEIDDDNESSDEFVFDFILPGKFNDAELRNAVTMMHEYLVRGTLMDWYNKLGVAFGQSMVYEVAELESKVVDIFRKPGFVKHPTMFYQPYMGGRRR